MRRRAGAYQAHKPDVAAKEGSSKGARPGTSYATGQDEVLARSRVRVARRCGLAAVIALALLGACAFFTPHMQSAGLLGEELTAALAADDGTHGSSAPATSGAPVSDPLSVEQEGISLQRVSADGRVLLYLSEWSASQSRVLFERALAVQGWLATGSEDEAAASFVYPATATAAGGSALVSAYETASGSSLLVQLL